MRVTQCASEKHGIGGTKLTAREIEGGGAIKKLQATETEVQL